MGGKICKHLLKKANELTPNIHFTGSGLEYNLVCEFCANDEDRIEANLQSVQPKEFAEFDEMWFERIVGQPEIKTRNTDLHFDHQEKDLSIQIDVEILDIVPKGTTSRQLWLALFRNGGVFELDTSLTSIKEIWQVPQGALEFSERVCLELSTDAIYLAIVNTYGQYGTVVNLLNKEIVMYLDRGGYRFEHQHFPVAFIAHNDRQLLIHATDWNRLDATNLETGERITQRELEKVEPSYKAEHYLDYFHAQLVVSPNSKWIAEDGWMWHPVGITRSRNLDKWVVQNVWESEGGSSLRELQMREGYWEGPLCWIDDTTLATWGFGNDDDWIIPAVQFFDVESGEKLRWFPGVQRGTLYYDEYLFSVSKRGVEIWDIDEGERLLRDESFSPMAYNPSTKEFISILAENRIQISKLVV